LIAMPPNTFRVPVTSSTVGRDETAAPIQLGLVGVGKIARDQHLPAIASNPAFCLLATASRHGSVAGAANFPNIERMIADTPKLAAVSLCAPPSVRAAMAREAIAAKLHVMLEKPPGMTISEVLDLTARARRQGTTLFASWHSREAAAVQHARDWLSTREVTSARVRWLEDVRVWHPGQEWIWQAGGFGVFDPGINALSILTHILPDPLVVTAAALSFPANRDTPMRAELTLKHGDKAVVDAAFSFCHAGVPCWDIDVETTDGMLRLMDGGSRLTIDDNAVAVPASTEYPNLYQRFAALIRTRQSDVDVSPLQLVADAFLCGRRIAVEPFLY
jgi:L-arabinose 1- dehydrogenase